MALNYNLDPESVTVAQTGEVRLLDVSDPDPMTFPAEGEELPGIGLGYTTEDGVTFSFSKDTEDIKGWQSPDPLRRLPTSTTSTVSFTLRELKNETWLATMGGTITKTAGGLYLWEPDPNKSNTKKVVIYFEDGDNRFLVGFRRMEQGGEQEFSLVRNDAVNLANEWTSLAAPKGKKSVYMVTNNAHMEGAA